MTNNNMPSWINEGM